MIAEVVAREPMEMNSLAACPASKHSDKINGISTDIEAIERQCILDIEEELRKRQRKMRRCFYPVIMSICIATFILASITLFLVLLGRPSSNSETFTPSSTDFLLILGLTSSKNETSTPSSTDSLLSSGRPSSKRETTTLSSTHSLLISGRPGSKRGTSTPPTSTRPSNISWTALLTTLTGDGVDSEFVSSKRPKPSPTPKTFPVKIQKGGAFSSILQSVMPNNQIKKLFYNETHTLIHFKKSGKDILIPHQHQD